MNLLLTKTQEMLLEIISDCSLEINYNFYTLCNEEWSQLLHMACQHRLEPVLYHQVKIRGFQKHLPQEIFLKLEVSYRKAAIISLNLQRLLFSLSNILDAASIPYLFTKGAWLAWNVYPHPALRPMRDVDILVRHEHAQCVFELLQSNGYIQTDSFSAPFSTLLKFNKHLPGLKCPQSLVNVEVHVRLLTANSKSPCPNEFSDFDKLYRRKQITDLGNKHLAYLSCTDTLLHIIVHAVDEHMFNNGPAVILDVFHALKRGGIDWKYFWDVAEKGNWTKAVQLIFDVVEYYNGDQNIVWRNFNRGETPLNIIQSASALTLQDIGARTNFTLAVDLAREKGIVNKYIRLLQKVVPSRYVLADIGNISAHNLFVIFIYPVWIFMRIWDLYKGKPKKISASNLVNPVIEWLSR